MKEDKIEFKILFRNPVYPAIIISKDQLFAAENIQNLALAVLQSQPPDEKDYIKVIDSTGEEFWYTTDLAVLAPGFAFKKWTKKQIIELYNNSVNSKAIGKSYSAKSLSNKKLSRIISDICQLIDLCYGTD